MATLESSKAGLAALVEAAHRRLTAQAERKSRSSSCAGATRVKSAGHGPFHTEERLRRRRERAHSASSPALQGIVATGRPVLQRRSHGARPSSASVHSATTDRRSTNSASTDRRTEARGEAFSKPHSKIPWRWFESAAEPVDRDASRVGASASVVTGRRYAGYTSHKTLRPRSAEPVLCSATEHSTSFVDRSQRKDVLQACETVYTREKRRDALLHATGGDPRRAATAASLSARHGLTEYQNHMHWRSSDDMAIAIGTSPDIEAARRDTEEAYYRVVERQLKELSLMEAARAAALSQRRSQSARASVRDSSQSSARSKPETTRWLRAELGGCVDEQLAQDIQLAKQKMKLRRQSSLLSSRASSSTSIAIADTLPAGSPLQRSAATLTEQQRIKAEVDAFIDTRDDVASWQSCETQSCEAEDEHFMEATASGARSKARGFEPMSTTEWMSMARCRSPAYEHSISGCSTAASSRCSTFGAESSRRSTRADVRKGLLSRPRSAGAATSLPDYCSEGRGDSVSLLGDTDSAINDPTEDDRAFENAIDELYNRYRDARQSGLRSSSSNGTLISMPSTRRRPSSAVGRLQTVSESAPLAKTKEDQSHEGVASLKLIDDFFSKVDARRKRQSGSLLGTMEKSVGSCSSNLAPNAMTPSRQRPSSAVARLQTSSSERATTAKTQASCGSAHSAVRAARQRPSSAGTHRPHKTKS